MATLGHAQVPTEGHVPGSALVVSATAVTLRHSALVRVTHWIITLCFFALLVTGLEIVISHPRFYWGLSRQCINHTTFQTSDPRIEGNRAYRLRLRAAGPEWLEPVSPLSSCLACRIHRFGVHDFQFIYGTFTQELASAQGRSLVAVFFDGNCGSFALPAAERGGSLVI